jgi:hypothetical protein
VSVFNGEGLGLLTSFLPYDGGVNTGVFVAAATVPEPASAVTIAAAIAGLIITRSIARRRGGSLGR